MEREQATTFMHELLRLMLNKNGSDLFISADFPAAFKIDGRLTPVFAQKLTAMQTASLVRAMMNDKQAAEFESTKECNFAISPNDIGRFRVNAFLQQGHVGMVLRVIQQTIPTLDSLQMPVIMKDLSFTKRGIILLVGATGNGKSTTLAAMVDHRNTHTFGHIVTVEDPIEFVHTSKNCLVTQREIGVDTDNWDIALRNSLRQAPDVIQIGEIRERSTMEQAIAMAETGHLVLATLHANNSNQALDRLINFVPDEKRQQLLIDLSLNLKAVISQRLVPLEDSKGRIPAMEILIQTPLISELIEKGEINEIRELMKRSTELGMQTFDQSLFNLFERHLISEADALRNADSINDLRLRMKLEGKRLKNNTEDAIKHLKIEA
ncbi:MAG: PilU twitching motility protein [Pseudomonadota bacterium]|jgi:twitching motility protein PilU